MTLTYQELKKKDVINVITGKNLGKITDLIIDASIGKIVKIVVAGKKGFLSCENEEINFDCITKIGDDTILYKPCLPKKQIDINCPCDTNIDCEDE